MIDGMDEEALRRVQHDRVLRRQTNELVGLARGVLLDGEVNLPEAQGLLAWLEANPVCCEVWPGNVLYERLLALLSGSEVTSAALDELRGVMMQMVAPRELPQAPPSTTLPLTIPPPPVVCRGRSFCFTGEFAFGSRRQCLEVVADRGGVPVDRVTSRLDYLVIGSVGSELWRHSSFGTKIIKAAELREAGARLAIIAEAHWVQSLEG